MTENNGTGLQCKGLIFRGKVNTYIDSHNNYHKEQRLLLVVKKSCKGCLQCHEKLVEIKEMVKEGWMPIKEDIVHKKLYSLQTIRSDHEKRKWQLEFLPYTLKEAL